MSALSIGTRDNVPVLTDSENQFVREAAQLKNDCASLNHHFIDDQHISQKAGHEILRIDLTIKVLFRSIITSDHLSALEIQEAINNLNSARISLLGQGIRKKESPAMRLQQEVVSLLREKTSKNVFLASDTFKMYQSFIDEVLNAITKKTDSEQGTSNEQLATALLIVADSIDKYSFKEVNRITKLLNGIAKVRQSVSPRIESSTFTITPSSSSCISSFSSPSTTTTSQIEEPREQTDDQSAEKEQFIDAAADVLAYSMVLNDTRNDPIWDMNNNWDEEILRLDLTIMQLFSSLATFAGTIVTSDLQAAIRQLNEARFLLIDKSFRFQVSPAMLYQQAASHFLNPETQTSPFLKSFNNTMDDLQNDERGRNIDSRWFVKDQISKAEPIGYEASRACYFRLKLISQTLSSKEISINEAVKKILNLASDEDVYSFKEIQHIAIALGCPKTTHVALNRIERFYSSSSGSSSSSSSTTTSSLNGDVQVVKESQEKLRSIEDPLMKNENELDQQVRKASYDLNLVNKCFKNTFEYYLKIHFAYLESRDKVTTLKKEEDELIKKIEAQGIVVQDREAEAIRFVQERDSLNSALEAHHKKYAELESVANDAISAAENAQRTKEEQEKIYKADKTNKAQWQIYSGALKSSMTCNQQLLRAEEELLEFSIARSELQEGLKKADIDIETAKREAENAAKKLNSLKSDLLKLQSDLVESTDAIHAHIRILDETEKDWDKATHLTKTIRRNLRNAMIELGKKNPFPSNISGFRVHSTKRDLRSSHFSKL